MIQTPKVFFVPLEEKDRSVYSRDGNDDLRLVSATSSWMFEVAAGIRPLSRPPTMRQVYKALCIGDSVRTESRRSHYRSIAPLAGRAGPKLNLPRRVLTTHARLIRAHQSFLLERTHAHVICDHHGELPRDGTESQRTHLPVGRARTTPGRHYVFYQ